MHSSHATAQCHNMHTWAAAVRAIDLDTCTLSLKPSELPRLHACLRDALQIRQLRQQALCRILVRAKCHDCIMSKENRHRHVA